MAPGFFLCNRNPTGKIHIRGKTLKTVQNQDSVISAAFQNGINFFIVGTKIDNTDVFVILSEIGNKTIGITVFNHKNTSFAVSLNGGEPVVSAQKRFIPVSYTHLEQPV